MASRPPTANRGYIVRQQDGVLKIVIAKEFGDISESSEWASTITGSAIGPFVQVEIDVSRMPTLASTTIAGLIQIQDAYRRKGTDTILLIGATDRTKRTLEMMRIDNLFEFR